MPEATRKKVLLVDDDVMIILSFRNVIKNAGFELETATRGKEALEKIQQSPPDVIILDAIMPEMNGFEVARKLKADNDLKKIPIIMLTGLKSPSDATDARMAGADDVLVKPVGPAKLLERIKFHTTKKTP